VTGKNVTTAIMDDGVDYMHPDLINNFVSFLHDDDIFNVFFFFSLNLLVYTDELFWVSYTKGLNVNKTLDNGCS
jgi:subtilisin family serine protease